MPEVDYVVRKPFKYNGILLQPGDFFTPRGTWRDKKILASKYVEVRHMALEKKIEVASETKHRRKVAPKEQE
jgi:hypothetical protein